MALPRACPRCRTRRSPRGVVVAAGVALLLAVAVVLLAVPPVGVAAAGGGGGEGKGGSPASEAAKQLDEANSGSGGAPGADGDDNTTADGVDGGGGGDGDDDAAAGANDAAEDDGGGGGPGGGNDGEAGIDDTTTDVDAKISQLDASVSKANANIHAQQAALEQKVHILKKVHLLRAELATKAHIIKTHKYEAHSAKLDVDVAKERRDSAAYQVDFTAKLRADESQKLEALRKELPQYHKRLGQLKEVAVENGQMAQQLEHNITVRGDCPARRRARLNSGWRLGSATFSLGVCVACGCVSARVNIRLTFSAVFALTSDGRLIVGGGVDVVVLLVPPCVVALDRFRITGVDRAVCAAGAPVQGPRHDQLGGDAGKAAAPSGAGNAHQDHPRARSAF